MTTYYVGSGGNNSNSGLTYALRRLTLTSIETLVAAGDIVYCAPGVFRETLTPSASGGSSYATGTVSVTNGSTTVTGSGTTFTGNSFADGVFQLHVLASGADGVTNGTATFTSAAGNFQSAHIGQTIRIGTKGAYIISAVASATSITLKNPDGSAPAPSAGSSLAYNVGPESPHRISSIDSNTQITLVSPWLGPTLTGIAYETWKDIRYIADITGQNTDGVGGIVRVTGSDNDTTITRTLCITATSKNYRTFSGFMFDSISSVGVLTSDCFNWIIQDCTFSSMTGTGIQIGGASQLNCTIRRCVLFCLGSVGINFTHTATVDNVSHVVENCLILANCNQMAVQVIRTGGILIRNTTVMSAIIALRVATALATGQAVTVNNCIVSGCVTALQATVTTEYIEDYNNVFGNGTARSNVTTGSNSVAYPPLFVPPLLAAGQARVPWRFGALSNHSLVMAKAGINESGTDLFGLMRPATSAKKSWGAIQFDPGIRDTGTVESGVASLKLSDAGRHQMFLPVANVSTTITGMVRRETDYAGTNPQVIIHQPGQTDITLTDAGASGAWNQLTTTFTPASSPGYVIVEFVSNNTATSGSFAAYFDSFKIVNPQKTGNFDNWIADRLNFNVLTTQRGGRVIGG